MKNSEQKEQTQDKTARIYMDGGFDLLHSGHYNAIRQASNLGDYLIVGVNSDADLELNKGPTIFNVKERSEIIRRCKFVQEVIEDTPYVPSEELLDSINCHFYAHGDDPVIDHTGFNLTEFLAKKGRLKTFKRTEGVSTTDLTGRLLELAEKKRQLASGELIETSPLKRFMQPPKQ